MVLWQQIFAILAMIIFLLRFLLKSASKSTFFGSGVEIPVLKLQIDGVVCCHSVVFCTSVSADRSGMAASRFIVAAAACVILLCFGAESRKSH